MKRKNQLLILFVLAPLWTFAQSNHTISIEGTNSGWTSSETFTNISTANNAYFTWDANYIYFAIAHTEADYGNMATFMYFDTDPMGSNGTTDAYAWVNNITAPFNADYVVVWKNQSGSDYIEVKQWNGSSWVTLNSATSTTLTVSGDDVVKFAIGTDYREVFVKRSYIGNPVAIRFCTFTEQQWGSYWRYYTWPNEGWTNNPRSSGQSIAHSYGFFLIDGVKPTSSPYYDASFNQFTGSGSDWNTASNWSKTAVPSNTHLVFIPTGKNVEISSTTQADAYDLVVDGSLTIKSTASGTGSLLHNSQGVSATVERYIAAASWTTWDAGWHLISSPVASQSISGDWTPSGSGDDYDFYAWDETNNQWLNQKTEENNITLFAPAMGYMVAYQQNKTQQFAGTLNVENITITNLPKTTGQGEGWHLLGNPFACALNWNDGNWALSNVASTAKIWNSSSKSYTDLSANDIIPSANGFFIQVSSGTNSLTIPIAARTHSNTAWYKNSDVPQLKLITRSLDNSSAQEFKLRMEPDATWGYDFYNDSRFLAGYAPRLYALCEGEKLSTSAIPDVDPGIAIDLGFSKIDGSEYTLELVENSLPFGVYLTDLKTGIQHNLTEKPIYFFSASENDPENRFKLTFAGVGIQPQDKPSLTLYAMGKTLFMRNLREEGFVEIYNLAGQLLSRTLTRQTELPLLLPSGIYLVKFVGNTQQGIEKIFIR